MTPYLTQQNQPKHDKDESLHGNSIPAVSLLDLAEELLRERKRPMARKKSRAARK